MAFIRTLSSFSDPPTMIRKLLQRYQVPSDWTKERVSLVRMRVGIALEAWLTFEGGHAGEVC